MREIKNPIKEVEDTQIGVKPSSRSDVLRSIDKEITVHLRGGAGGQETGHEDSGEEEEGYEYEFEDAFQTHRNTDIDIYRPVAGTAASVVSEQDERGFFADEGIPQNQLQKVANADPDYNCHGYTFANGKGWITESSAVRRIVSDNQIRETHHPKVDDVVLYQDNVHSGVVVALDPNGRPIIESKFGKYGLYRHYAGTLSGAYGTHRYYRPHPDIGRVLYGAYDSD